MIAIIDFGMGNLGSIQNMIKKVGGNSLITNDITILSRADAIILPGVGSFDSGVDNLLKYDLFQFLKDFALEKRKPILGICLGMQLMTERSEEGVKAGLGLIKGETIKFKVVEDLKVPYMGWNFVRKAKEGLLFDDFTEVPRFYFVHSYYVKCTDRKDVLGQSVYGDRFDSAFQRDNIMGVQFHPEKSHRFGMIFMRSFLKLVYNDA